MKKITIILMLTSILISCSNNNANSSQPSYYGKWKLVKMTGKVIPAIHTIGEPQWQEFYVFNTNKTFTKTRIKDKVTTTASGTFKIINIQDETNLELSYTENSDIIGSCYGNQKEDLFMNSDNLLSSTWQNCDGPGLIYEKTN
jgi:hypothetical protein